jgi:hypothetical protein
MDPDAPTRQRRARGSRAYSYIRLGHNVDLEWEYTDGMDLIRAFLIAVRLARIRRYRSGAHRTSTLRQPVYEADHTADTLHDNHLENCAGRNSYPWKRECGGDSKHFSQESWRSISQDDSRCTISYVAICNVVLVGSWNFMPSIHPCSLVICPPEVASFFSAQPASVK